MRPLEYMACILMVFQLIDLQPFLLNLDFASTSKVWHSWYQTTFAVWPQMTKSLLLAVSEPPIGIKICPLDGHSIHTHQGGGLPRLKEPMCILLSSPFSWTSPHSPGNYWVVVPAAPALSEAKRPWIRDNPTAGNPF